MQKIFEYPILQVKDMKIYHILGYLLFQPRKL